MHTPAPSKGVHSVASDRCIVPLSRSLRKKRGIVYLLLRCVEQMQDYPFIEAEGAALGRGMATSQAMATLASEITPDFLYKDQHRGIYSVMLQLHCSGVGVDAVTVSDKIAHEGREVECGDFIYINELAQNAHELIAFNPDPPPIESYIAIIKREYAKRSYILTYHNA
jgi:replicative DNA helicase